MDTANQVIINNPDVISIYFQGDIIANIPTVQKLEIRDSGLSAMGCELLAKSMLINNRKLKSLVTLRLDFNRIGSAGLLQISKGLVNNRCVRRLSFGFCGINGDKHANDALHNILSNCFLLELSAYDVLFEKLSRNNMVFENEES